MKPKRSTCSHQQTGKNTPKIHIPVGPTTEKQVLPITDMLCWMIITVETTIGWPAIETSVTFAGETLLLRPQDGDSSADVRMQYAHPQNEHATFELISRFLSCLSWWYHMPARGDIRISSTAPMRGGGLRPGPPLVANFSIPSDLTIPTAVVDRLSLALYREAASVNHLPFEFLGYFKVINASHNKSKDQIAWMNQALPQISDSKALSRIANLNANEPNVGKYLYGSGRCAVAHAFQAPVIDPDLSVDLYRLGDDLPVVRALAEYLIEHDLGIKWNASR
ncbi:methylamine utilization protein MauJ [Rhodopirellula bahusiensis]|uniref:methylamine utilization protein MauJ n=1 Tax=Rhodopirellula bahusiensis TaxID=2014065 RepID=UPI003267F10C